MLSHREKAGLDNWLIKIPDCEEQENIKPEIICAFCHCKELELEQIDKSEYCIDCEKFLIELEKDTLLKHSN